MRLTTLGALGFAFILALAGLTTACGDGDSADGSGNTTSNDADTGEEGESGGGGGEGDTGGTCGVMNCTGGVAIDIDSGPTLASEGYASVSCVVTEDQEGALLIQLQRQDDCDGTGTALVATWRIPVDVDTAGVHVLDLADVAASWSLQNGPDEYTGAYFGQESATLDLEVIDRAPGGRVAGRIESSVSAPALMLTGSAAASFDISLE
jgi:hypothetical protein